MYVLLTQAIALLQEAEEPAAEEESGIGLLLPATEELIAGVIAFVYRVVFAGLVVGAKRVDRVD